MTKAIVLFSGGLDSVACLYWALQNYEDIILMSFLYGSKEDEVIEKTNKKFASLLSIESKIISVPFLGDFAQTAVTIYFAVAFGKWSTGLIITLILTLILAVFRFIVLIKPHLLGFKNIEKKDEEKEE